MSTCRTPEVAQGVDHGALHRRGGAEGAGLADALGAELVEVGRRLGVGGLEADRVGARSASGSRRRSRSAAARPRRRRTAPTAPARCPGRCRRAAGRSTIVGLRMRPQSSTATCRSGTTRPVSVSTSTTETWAPNGKVAPAWGTSRSARSELAALGGRGPELGPSCTPEAGHAGHPNAVVGHLDVLGGGLEQLGRERDGLLAHGARRRRPRRCRPAGATGSRRCRRRWAPRRCRTGRS